MKGGRKSWAVCRGEEETHLRDTFLVLPAIESCPCDSARVLTLQKERFRLATLETENLVVTTDVDFSLSIVRSHGQRSHGQRHDTSTLGKELP